MAVVVLHILPICCPFNSGALIPPKGALPWENGHMCLDTGIIETTFFAEKAGDSREADCDALQQPQA